MTRPEPETGGVLSSLPNTRPQHRSPKRGPAAAPPAAELGRPGAPPPSATPATARRRARTAATDATARPAGTAAARARPAGASQAPTGTARPRSSPPGRRGERAPLAAQGFESRAAHEAIEPPSRADLLGSVAQGAGDLAHVGVALSRQLLRSVLGRLPGT